MIRAPNTLRAVSYNLLADQFAYHHTYCPPQALQWPHRIARILHQLVELDSDLLFLQEVEHRVYHQQLQATLDTLGYDSLYCSTRPNPEEDFGPVLAYRRDRLGLSHPESKRTCTFCSALNSWHPPAVDAPDDAFHGPLRTHGEGAAMAMLHTTTGPPSSAQTVVAVSTHLHWDPRLPDVKATQAAVLCSEVERFRKSMGAPDAAVIIGGDFNSLPEKRQPDAFDPKIAETGLVSGAYTIMTQGYMATDHPDHPVVRRALSSTSQYPFHDAGLGLVSVNAVAHGREPLVTNCTETFRGCLDYVFVSAERCRVAAALEMPYAQHAGDVLPSDIKLPAIPNTQHPSDHLPVGGDIVLL